MKRFIGGFFTGASLFLSFHSTSWGRIGTVVFALILTIIIVKSMDGKWRCMLFFVVPLGLFLLSTYFSNMVDKGLNQKTPAQVADDLLYYCQTTGKSTVLKQGKKDFAKAQEFSFFVTREESIHWTLLAFVCFSGFLVSGVYDQCDRKKIKSIDVLSS